MFIEEKDYSLQNGSEPLGLGLDNVHCCFKMEIDNTRCSLGILRGFFLYGYFFPFLEDGALVLLWQEI